MLLALRDVCGQFGAGSVVLGVIVGGVGVAVVCSV